MRDRYAQCDDRCTLDCGVCKGAGRPVVPRPNPLLMATVDGSPAVPLNESMTAADADRAKAAEVLLVQVWDGPGLEALVAQAVRDGDYCCQEGCGNGACSICPCCSAGWCVSGLGGLPDDPEDFARWLEIAAEHSPVAAALAEARAPYDRLTADLRALVRELEAEGRDVKQSLAWRAAAEDTAARLLALAATNERARE